MPIFGKVRHCPRPQLCLCDRSTYLDSRGIQTLRAALLHLEMRMQLVSLPPPRRPAPTMIGMLLAAEPRRNLLQVRHRIRLKIRTRA